MTVRSHTKYTKIVELKQELSSMYSRLTSINDDKFKSLVQAFMYDPNSNPVHVPNAIATDLISPTGVNSKVLEFQNLLKDAVDCHIEPNEISSGASTDNNIKMNGLLKFVKPQASGGVPANSVKVEGENRVACNIVSSVNVINAFLDILKSYELYVTDPGTNSIKDITNIFIVNAPPVANKKFKYLEGVTSDLLVKPSISALYLQLNTNIYTALINDSPLEVYTKYQGTSVIKTSELASASSSPTFTSDALTLLDSSGIGYVRGLRIRKLGPDSVIDEMKSDKSAMNTPEPILQFDKNMSYIANTATVGSRYAANLKSRDQYLLKHFLNILININKESRRTTIKILQTYYITLKILLLTAVNTGNHLYNSHFQTGTTVHASGTLFGLKGIDVDNFPHAGLYTSDAINTAFKIDTTYSTGITGQDDIFHSKINELISKITIDSANSIQVGTSMPTLSDGFYAKKIDAKHIEISGISTSSYTYTSLTIANFKSDSANFLNTTIQNSMLDAGIKSDFTNFTIKNIKNRYKITINKGRYDIVDIKADGTTGYKLTIRASLNDTRLYPISSEKLDDTKYKILDLAGNVFTVSLEQGYLHDAKYVIFAKDTTTSSTTNKVKLAETTPLDNAEEYNGLKTEITKYNENINMNKSKITNHTTLYELHKSKHNVLNTQLISYYIIIGVVIGAIVAVNLANVEKSLVKTIALGCFAVIILLFMSYYVMNVLYISEDFTVEHFASAFTTTPSAISNEYDVANKNIKKGFVEARMNNYCEAIILALKILKPSLENSSLINTSSELLRIGNNERQERLYINNILINKRDNAEINIDVLKYENMNFAVHIKALLITSLIVIGVYTLHFYTEPKYLDLLLFITSILLISVFTYFVVYSNKIVRTIPTNNYWGREEKKSYGVI